jgi:hypothetical protein
MWTVAEILDCRNQTSLINDLSVVLNDCRSAPEDVSNAFESFEISKRIKASTCLLEIISKAPDSQSQATWNTVDYLKIQFLFFLVASPRDVDA